ncbi:speckle targeted PIP5K1A-regulated poly(A) polymerase [Papilio machaon]|uniref:speckle targeted PIP5K1A-regulated poly(A) polymerase n=1 Tax=Papilio machaon TaxID=76193 RepID=UPI001E6645E5|nr:speckle targeted PIP5K1A-regulated poly(A) polymerase [Papilio machaon]XP_014355414.2 speckle targeted PIP5K1A-regulated poly(A) polymerase [Papilio machaon]XP_045536791.1 speckle targeted PIP5K1A-regulated poly(A) polymerase [Papilio machaon]
MEVKQKAPVCNVPNKVYVTGFPMYTQPQDLERVFSEYGKVKVDKVTKQYATLSFSNSEEAKAATKQSKKIAVYGELVCVKPFYTKPLNAATPKKEHQKTKKGRTILSPHEILLSGEFDEQLENVLMAIRLTQEEVKQIGDLYSDLEEVLQVIWPGCTAIPFGSITTGLGVKCSDADCFINIPNKQQHSNNNYIMKARKALYGHKLLFSDIVPIPHANTPIIKLYHLPSRTHCDLTFKTPLGTRNSRLIDFLLHADPRLLPLALLVRYWAQAHGFTGTRRVTNYALTMMIIFYLQQAPISILPSIRWLQRDPADGCDIDDWNAGFMSDYARLPNSTNTSSVAELLGGFFQYYATFDFNQLVVCPYLGYPVKKALFADNSTLPHEFERYRTNLEKNLSLPLKFTTPICVQDPFEHSHNVACGISAKMADDLCTLFNFAASAYEREKLNGCRGFLRIILLQKPKTFGIKYATEYKTNISPKEITAIKNPDWKSVVRDVTEIIFVQILGIALNKGEEKTIDSQKEKVTFTTKATKAVWRRKYSSKMCYMRHSEFLERQKSLTNEIIKVNKHTFELDFQVELTFTNEPRRVKICMRYLNGDKDLFREFGRFFNNIINPWFKTLLRPHTRPMTSNHNSPNCVNDDLPNCENDVSPDGDNDISPDCDNDDSSDCDEDDPDETHHAV